jgi:hypothetical protein
MRPDFRQTSHPLDDGRGLWVPWEKLRRKTSTPAAIRSPITASLFDEGPRVAMILVRRVSRMSGGFEVP